MGEISNTQRILVRNPEQKGPLGDSDVGDVITLNKIL
jgi:hypothetical protein